MKNHMQSSFLGVDLIRLWRDVKVFIGIAIFSSLISGCATTGGTVGGLFPAPKLWKGKVADGIYTSPHGDFRIRIPQAADSYEFQYLQVKEQYGVYATPDYYAYVSFGPAAFDQRIFRVSVMNESDKAPQSSFQETANKILAGLIGQVERGYNAKAKQLHLEEAGKNGHEGIYAVYEQTLSQKIGGADTLCHVLYVTRSGDKYVYFWVQVSSAMSGSVSGKSTREQLIERNYSPANEFIDSFELIPSATGK